MATVRCACTKLDYAQFHETSGSDRSPFVALSSAYVRPSMRATDTMDHPSPSVRATNHACTVLVQAPRTHKAPVPTFHQLAEANDEPKPFLNLC